MYFGGVLVAAAVLFGLFWLLAGRVRRPERFTLGQGRFTAPASPVAAGSLAMMWMFFSASAVVAERVPSGDRMRLAEFEIALPATAIGVGLFWALALVTLVIQRPRLHLDPGGLTIRRLLRTTAIAWDELANAGLPPAGEAPGGRLRLYPDRYTAPVDVPFGRLHIDPAFLTHAIAHYVEHPADRAAIGTEEGMRQLHAAVARPRPEG